MDIIGQTKLIQQIKSHTYQTLPRTILLIGEHGCGKQKMAEFIAAYFDMELVKIASDVTPETLLDYMQSPIRALYTIDLSGFNEKQQNKLLKFIEEPSVYSHVLLMANSEVGLLPTITNRCIKLFFEPYSEQELENYKLFENKLVYKLCKTPGQLDELDNTDILGLINYCNFIVDKFAKANYANALAISTKINYKEDYNKYNINIFFNALEYCSYLKYREEQTEESYIIYNVTNKYKQLLANNIFNKENLMLGFLTDLWEALHDASRT